MKNEGLRERDPGLAYVESKIRNVPDFPTPGILFKDITPALADRGAFMIMIDRLAESLHDASVDVVVGMEARGFIFGAPLAHRLRAGFVPARKPGRLPAEVDSVSYTTEYSKTELQMHRGSFLSGARVLIVDDVLATGGTAEAAGRLAAMQGATISGYAFVIELAFLRGRARLEGSRVESLLTY